MMKSKTQIIYDLTFETAQKICEQVYQYLPMIDVGYPFAVVNETETNADVSKDKLFQTVNISVDFWGNDKQRKQLDDFSNQLLNQLIGSGLITSKSGYQIEMDHSTDEVLFCSHVELSFEWR